MVGRKHIYDRTNLWRLKVQKPFRNAKQYDLPDPITQHQQGERTSAIDKQLNIIYNKLIKEMPPQFKQKLIKSEQDWMNYRDSTVSITAWQEAGGSAQLLNQDGEYLSLEKSRLKFLKSLLN
jgi:uncharacterized protein YecT (DUF1311 family)